MLYICAIAPSLSMVSLSYLVIDKFIVCFFMCKPLYFHWKLYKLFHTYANEHEEIMHVFFFQVIWQNNPQTMTVIHLPEVNCHSLFWCSCTDTDDTPNPNHHHCAVGSLFFLSRSFCFPFSP